MWAETFEENISSFPELQVSISDKVLKALTIELSANERRQINKSYTQNSEAYQLYLAGRYLMSNRSAENLNKAIKTFEKARDTDPTFVLAYAGMADAYALLNLYQIPPPKDAYVKAKENALKALEFDADLAEAHAALGYILFYGERRRTQAAAELKRALELNPSYSTAYHWSGLAFAAMGRSEEAIGYINKAMELEPRSAVVHSAAGLVYYYAGRYDEALGFCRESLEINAGFVPAHKTMRVIYEAMGKHPEAREAYQKERLFVGNTGENEPGWLMITAQVEAVGGLRDAALGNLKRAEEAPVVKNNPKAYADEIAIGYALLGEKEKALEWIAKAKEASSHSFNFAAVEPRYNKIKDDPRFAELTRISE
jgi:tetratricopeptide (TPR) repeat protein